MSMGAGRGYYHVTYIHYYPSDPDGWPDVGCRGDHLVVGIILAVATLINVGRVSEHQLSVPLFR